MGSSFISRAATNTEDVDADFLLYVQPPSGLFVKLNPIMTRNHAASQVGVANVSGHQAIQVIQTRLLLAVYLLDRYRVLEGRAHLSAATSLAFRLRLHKIRSAQASLSRGTLFDPIVASLPEPQNAVEEGERIRAFWTVFSMSRIHAVMFGHYSLILDSDDEERRIDTPWPLDMSLYEQVSRRLK